MIPNFCRLNKQVDWALSVAYGIANIVGGLSDAIVADRVVLSRLICRPRHRRRPNLLVIF